MKSTNKTTDQRFDYAEKRLDKIEADVSILKEDVKIIYKKLDENDEKARGYRDDVLNKMDLIVGKLHDMREDKLIGEYQIKERINNHEERLKNLEKFKNPL